MAGMSDVFATAAEDIRVWEDKNFTLKHHISKPLTSISRISWSPNGQWLATASSNDEKVVAHYCRKHSTLPLELKPPVHQTGVRFNNTSSRYVMTWSNQSAAVLWWDLKTRKVKKQLNTSLAEGINCVSCNGGDTHIACGSVDGKIQWVNVTTSVALSPVSTPNTQGISALEYNRHHQNMLGAVSDDGSCNLWDSNTRKLIHSFHYIHGAPATGLSFSPVNELLFATVGLDKRILFHDSQSKKTVLKVDAEAPLMSVDFFTDGSCICVGSTRGSVFIYDIRSSSSPLRSFVAHRTSVQSVCVKKSSVLSEMDAFAISNELVSPLVATSPIPKTTFSPKLDKTIQNGNIEDSVFSPLQDDQSDAPSGQSGAQILRRHSMTDASIIFSPVEVVDENSKLVYNIKTPDGFYSNSSNETIGYSSFSHPNPVLAVPTVLSNALEYSESTNIPEKAEKSVVPDNIAGTNSTYQVINPAETFAVETRNDETTLSLTPSSNTDANHSQRRAQALFSESATEPSGPVNANNISQESVAALCSTFTEALDSVRESVHEDIGNLHLDMIRGFFAQELMIQELSKCCAALASEMVTLKRENAQLRRQQ